MDQIERALEGAPRTGAAPAAGAEPGGASSYSVGCFYY